MLTPQDRGERAADGLRAQPVPGLGLLRRGAPQARRPQPPHSQLPPHPAPAADQLTGTDNEQQIFLW